MMVFVLSGPMMLSCFALVTRRMRMMLCRLLMVLGCFLGHSGVSAVCWPYYSDGQQPEARIRKIVPL
jgi:hypothetical protein